MMIRRVCACTGRYPAAQPSFRSLLSALFMVITLLLVSSCGKKSDVKVTPPVASPPVIPFSSPSTREKPITEEEGRAFLEVIKQADMVKIEEALKQNPGLARAHDEIGMTPLHYAAQDNKILLMKMLITCGAEVDANYRYGGTPLYLAAATGKKEAVKLLLSHGADINARDREGMTALFQATAPNAVDMMELLISHGADVDAVDKGGYTPLHTAALAGAKEAAALLISKGADVNSKLKSQGSAARGDEAIDGDTPLHLAAEKGDKPMVELLLSQGAEINAKNSQGITPLRYASAFRHEDIAEFLKKNGAE